MVRFLRDAFTGEKVTTRLRQFRDRRFRLGVRPEQTPPILVAGLREGMLRLAGREADGAIINWLAARPTCQVCAGGQRGRRGRGARDRGPHLRVPEREPGRGARQCPVRDRRLHERAGVRRLPGMARPRRRSCRDVGGMEGRRPQGGVGRDSRTRWWTTSSCTVRRPQCRARIEQYFASGVTTSALAILPLDPDLGHGDAVRALAPNAAG